MFGKYVNLCQQKVLSTPTPGKLKKQAFKVERVAHVTLSASRPISIPVSVYHFTG